MTRYIEIVASWVKLEEFRSKMRFLYVDCSTLTAAEAEQLPQRLAARLALGREATDLFQGMGQQICADLGVKWGEVPPDIPGDHIVSNLVEEKFKEFLEFIQRNS